MVQIRVVAPGWDGSVHRATTWYSCLVSPHTGMALLVLVHALLTALWLGAYVLLLAKARAFFEKPVVRRTMDRDTGVVLIGFGLKARPSRDAANP